MKVISNLLDYILISVAKWKKLTAKTVKTRERFRGYETNPRESSTIPGIELFDIIDGELPSAEHFILVLLSRNNNNYFHCFSFLFLDHEVNLASILILENFAVPANIDDTPTPLSRYSSSESVLRLDGGSSSDGSVAEKARMFELTASLQNSRNTPSPRPNSNGHKSPSRFSSSPRKSEPEKDAQKENNGNVKNVLIGGEEKSSNFQDMLTQQLLSNKTWAEIMDNES